MMATKALNTGTEIGPFRIIKLLGEGGVGRVYAALDSDLGRVVALKALRPEVSNDTGFVERFRGEAASLARLQHPNITTLYALHRDGRDLYMVMEMVRGYTLEDVLQQQGRIGTDTVRALAAQACAGLGYAHRMGVIHRDIKPSNLMLTESGVLKIMDFGIARVRGSQRMTRVGSIVGTLAYMPPEQIKGSDNDERSDIYSLGCVFYELLCGSVPFAANSEYELIQAQVGQEPPPLRGRCLDLDHDTEATLQRAMAKNPGERFADSSSFARALGAANLPGDPADIAGHSILSRMPPLGELTADAHTGPQTGTSTATPRRTAPERPKASPIALAGGRKWLPGAVLGGVAVCLVAGFGFFLMPSQPVQTESAAASPGIEPAQNAASNESLPVNPNILPPPDAQGTTNAAIAHDAKPDCSSATDADFVSGHVDGISSAGWPEVGGTEKRLYGVHDLAPGEAERLSGWLGRKGDEIACCTMADGAQLCRTDGEHHQDVSLYLLLNGLARADESAPKSYLDAEADARANRRGVWQ